MHDNQALRRGSLTPGSHAGNTSNPHASTRLDRHWSSPLHWVSEWLDFISAGPTTAERGLGGENHGNQWKDCNRKLCDSSMKGGGGRWHKWACAGAGDEAGREAEDQVKLILESCGGLWRFVCYYYPGRSRDRAPGLTRALTDLAVAEMYWTTISRLVLRSLPRRGALRSSFRFMSSWKHTGTRGEQH